MGRAKPKPDEACRWKLELEDRNGYTTSCGSALWILVARTPANSKMRICPNCGKRIKVQR